VLSQCSTKGYIGVTSLCVIWVLYVVKVRFSVRVEKELVEKLDQLAMERGLSRSKLVEHILSEYVGVKVADDPCIPIETLQKKLDELERRLSELEKELGRKTLLSAKR